MPDYKNGKIYKLWCPDNDLIYIGSTIQPLHIRLGGHKKKNKDCSSKLLFQESNNVKIELIEEFACENRIQLNKKEGEHIRANDCVNKVIPGRTQKEYHEEWYEDNKDKKKEYYEDNKDKIREKQKEYRENNKEYLKEYREKNKDIILQQKKKYYEKKKDIILQKQKEQKREYYEKNKDILNQKAREKYRLKKLQNIE